MKSNAVWRFTRADYIEMAALIIDELLEAIQVVFKTVGIAGHKSKYTPDLTYISASH